MTTLSDLFWFDLTWLAPCMFATGPPRHRQDPHRPRDPERLAPHPVPPLLCQAGGVAGQDGLGGQRWVGCAKDLGAGRWACPLVIYVQGSLSPQSPHWLHVVVVRRCAVRGPRVPLSAGCYLQRSIEFSSVFFACMQAYTPAISLCLQPQIPNSAHCLLFQSHNPGGEPPTLAPSWPSSSHAIWCVPPQMPLPPLVMSPSPAGGEPPTLGPELALLKPRILVCAPSNAAIDELLERILKDGFKGREGRSYRPSVCRVGADEALNEGVRQVRHCRRFLDCVGINVRIWGLGEFGAALRLLGWRLAAFFTKRCMGWRFRCQPLGAWGSA